MTASPAASPGPNSPTCILCGQHGGSTYYPDDTDRWWRWDVATSHDAWLHIGCAKNQPPTFHDPRVAPPDSKHYCRHCRETTVSVPYWSHTRWRYRCVACGRQRGLHTRIVYHPKEGEGRK